MQLRGFKISGLFFLQQSGLTNPNIKYNIWTTKLVISSITDSEQTLDYIVLLCWREGAWKTELKKLKKGKNRGEY